MRITKERVKFPKENEQTFSRDISCCQGYTGRPQHVYEVTDLKDSPIEDQIYNYEIAKVTVANQILK